MKCGFFKKDITPPMDCYLVGNTITRKCSGIDDPLHVRSLVFQEEGIAVFLCFDLVGIKQDVAMEIREYVARQIGCDVKDVFVSATHTHTGPNLANDRFPFTIYLRDYLKYFAAAAAEGAIADLKESKFSFACGELPGVTFVRRYRMKNGTFRTNPGRHNPDILEPAAPADETVRLLKITREGAGDIALVNFQVHPDVHGGTRISADYPAVVCDTLEGALPGTHCFYMNGTAGDLNHIDVNCPEWDKNGGPEHALHMGRSIAGKVLSLYTKARPVATGPVRTALQDVTISMKVSTPENVAYATEIQRLHEAGELDKVAELSGTTPTVAAMEARAIFNRLRNPKEKTVTVSAASMGDFSVVGIPGEGFCDIGRQIRNQSPFGVQFMSGLTNGSEGYFPTADAFAVDGYESRISHFRPGVGEAMIAAGNALTSQLFSEK